MYERTSRSLLVRGIATFGAAISLPLAAQNVPPKLQPPSNEQLVLQVHAKGEQIYTCKEDIDRFAWILKGPDAQLFDKAGKVVGKHFLGPSWQMNDGSSVKGESAANAPAPNADAIPWLLVKVVSHEGNGVLSPVTSIQRINTNGGKAPASGCDSVATGKEIRVPYSADYLFYAPK